RSATATGRDMSTTLEASPRPSTFLPISRDGDRTPRSLPAASRPHANRGWSGAPGRSMMSGVASGAALRRIVPTRPAPRPPTFPRAPDDRTDVHPPLLLRDGRRPARPVTAGPALPELQAPSAPLARGERGAL